MKTNGTIVNVQSKAYDFNGKQGVSNRATVIVGDAVFSCRVSEAVLSEIKGYANVPGVLQFSISSFSMKPTLTLVDFEKGK